MMIPYPCMCGFKNDCPHCVGTGTRKDRDPRLLGHLQGQKEDLEKRLAASWREEQEHAQARASLCATLSAVEAAIVTEQSRSHGRGSDDNDLSPELVRLADQVLDVLGELDPKDEDSGVMLRELLALGPRKLFVEAAIRVLNPLEGPEEAKLAQCQAALCALETDTGAAPTGDPASGFASANALPDLVYRVTPGRTQSETTMLNQLREIDRSLFIQASIPLVRRAAVFHEQRLERLRALIGTLGAARAETT